MSVDHIAVGGIGFEINDVLLKESTRLTNKDLEEFNQDKTRFLDEILCDSCMIWQEYGNAFTGDIEYMVVMDTGNYLQTAWNTAPKFLTEFNERFGLTKQLSDLKLLSKVYSC